LSRLAGCDVFIDEGQWIFDSYEGTKFSKAKRKLILHTRHYNRSLNIISQRTQALHVSARGQVNRFFKCTKLLSWPFLVFNRIEYQEMKDESVDLEKPYRTRFYFAGKKRLSGFDSKYMRGGIANSEPSKYYKFKYGYLDIWKEFFQHVRFIRRKGKQVTYTPEMLSPPGTLVPGGQTKSIRNIKVQ